MGKHFALSMKLPKHQSNRRAQAVNSRGKARSYGPLLFWACCLLLVLYFFQVNSFSTKGFEIRALQKKVSNLQEAGQQLQVQSAELQSLQKIRQQQSFNNLETVNTVTYLRHPSFSQK